MAASTRSTRSAGVPNASLRGDASVRCEKTMSQIRNSLPEETGPVSIDKCVIGRRRLPVAHGVNKDRRLDTEGGVGVVDDLLVLQAADEAEI